MTFSHGPPEQADLVIDALLGIGARRALEGRAAQWQARMAQAIQAGVPVLAIDLASGLNADTGQGQAVQATHTLSLLTLKHGLFTAQGRDAAGPVWFDTLGVAADTAAPTAQLLPVTEGRQRPNDPPKGRRGDGGVVVWMV